MENNSKIYVVGIGPGEEKQMTVYAGEVLRECDIIVGYTGYIELIRELYPEKELFSTGMRSELERCKKCVELAKEGKTVALICSGDAGVYGMASPLYEVAAEEAFDRIEVVPGVTAAVSGAAVLGAPVNHDFCLISLSDLLTPWEVIEKRLLAAAEGDFVIALYNPSSHKRADYLKKACEILLRLKAPDTVCGYVQNIGREGCNSTVLTLRELQYVQVDMFTTVFVGNSQTGNQNGKMVTPRGYHEATGLRGKQSL